MLIYLHASQIVGEDSRSGEEVVTSVQPKLLEITYLPANNAVNLQFSKQYPTFVNDMFSCLFLGEFNNVTRLL